MTRYKLNVKRDVDFDEPDGPILNLPRGWRFSDDVVHTRGYASMVELRAALRTEIVTCDCQDCQPPAKKQETKPQGDPK